MSSLKALKSLILGGVKSGKSRHAEKLAEAMITRQAASVVVIATAQAHDDEMAERIAKHQLLRDDAWRVIEEPIHLAQAINTAHIIPDSTQYAEQRPVCLIIDCLTVWVSNLLMREDDVLLNTEIDAFLNAFSSCDSRLLVVSNETNMGVIPMGELTRRFCDVTGTLHQQLAAQADEVFLMVAGIAQPIKAGVES